MAESEMAHRIAEAICESSGQSWASSADGYREICLGFAHAAIEAMREPTDAMISAAVHEHATNAPYKTPFGPNGSFALQWRAMIDRNFAPRRAIGRLRNLPWARLCH